MIGNSKVLLAPLRFGAGIKGKLTDAMLNGTPSVTTSIGAEGMCGELPWNGFIEDDFQKFAEKAEELFTDKDTWSFAQNGDVAVYYLRDTTNFRFYRITLMVGSSYINNMISIEKII